MKRSVYIGLKKYAVYFKSIVEKTLEFFTFPVRFISNKAQELKNYTIYGNSVQNGTPTPTAPQEIESVGDRTNNLYDKTIAKKDTLISSTTGLETKSVGYYASDFIPVQVGKTYVRCLNGTKYANVVLFYDDSKNFIRSYAPGAGVPFTIPQDVSYIRFNTGSQDVDFVALIEGTQNTPYEPYGYKIPIKVDDTTTADIYLSEPLRRIGNYADYIDFESQKVVRNVKEIILNGNEDWRYYDISGIGKLFRTTVDTTLASGIKSDLGVISNKYTTVVQSARTNNTLTGIERNVDLINDNFSDVTIWKNDLARDNVKVYYPLETPSEETITLPAISLSQNIVTIDIDTNIKPSKLTITGDVNNE